MKPTLPLLGMAALAAAAFAPAESLPALRPPSVPLVSCDPYFSIWSPGDKLTDVETTHWTGKPQRLSAVLRIDGREFRVMGKEPAIVPALPQTGLEVTATQSVYSFAGDGIALRLAFLTPALPDDLDVLARPVTYVTATAKATDGKPHQLELRFTASGELATNMPNQLALADRVPGVGGLTVLRAGSKDQAILAKRGDDIRIDWGFVYLAAPSTAIKDAKAAPAAAATTPTPAGDIGLTVTLGFGPAGVGGEPVSRWLMLAYDDLYSIQYMKRNLRPYWRRNGWEAADLLQAAARDYPDLVKRCDAFDAELRADVVKAGGEPYARIIALAHRQCFAAGKFVADANGQPLQFCKENHSNGCIGTSDVFYPMAPQFLFYGPTLTKSFLVPFMNYASSERWRFPFAPHDLGQYPHANGQVYGGGERTEDNQMPVEETGNLLLLFGALAQMEGSADFAGLYWPTLEKWAAYLKDKGFDPENQLCTDDFAGHLAHNVNLSAKAICALGTFAKLCEMRGEKAAAAEYAKTAREYAARWVKEADDGGKFRLAFDRPGTWSLKYNLVWDRILGLGLFPQEVKEKELAFYRTVQNDYGVPLDNRKGYTKLDWILWSATLTGKDEDFAALVAPVHRFIQETPDRSPLTDWYETKSARKVSGFTGRPVIGGVYCRMLYDKEIWAKYTGREKTKGAKWAPMPVPPKVKVVVPTARESKATWKFTTRDPGTGWERPGFSATGWKDGQSGFGSRGTPGAAIGTEWRGPHIWLRREIELPANARKLQLLVHHDEDVEVFLNGVPAASASGFTTDYDVLPIHKEALAALRPGRNLIAIHCRQTEGGQFIDAGFAEVVP